MRRQQGIGIGEQFGFNGCCRCSRRCRQSSSRRRAGQHACHLCQAREFRRGRFAHDHFVFAGLKQAAADQLDLGPQRQAFRPMPRRLTIGFQAVAFLGTRGKGDGSAETTGLPSASRLIAGRVGDGGHRHVAMLLAPSPSARSAHHNGADGPAIVVHLPEAGRHGQDRDQRPHRAGHADHHHQRGAPAAGDGAQAQPDDGRELLSHLAPRQRLDDIEPLDPQGRNQTGDQRRHSAKPRPVQKGRPGHQQQAASRARGVESIRPDQS